VVSEAYVTTEERSEKWQLERDFCCWFQDIGVGQERGLYELFELTSSNKTENLVLQPHGTESFQEPG